VLTRFSVPIDNVARIAKALGVEPWKLLKDGRYVAKSAFYVGSLIRLRLLWIRAV
jgi:hypothetical protein